MAIPSYRLGRAAGLLGISVDTLRRWADSGRVATRRTEGGHRVIDGPELARLAAGLAPRGGGAAGSIRNRFPGIVTRVTRDRAAAQVEVQAGTHRIVALVTREAADELHLAPGVPVVATVKATNVAVEVAGEG